LDCLRGKIFSEQSSSRSIYQGAIKKKNSREEREGSEEDAKKVLLYPSGFKNLNPLEHNRAFFTAIFSQLHSFVNRSGIL
jgi:hypothetical protein